MINFETANESELTTRNVGDRTFHTLRAANTDWETDIEIGIPDNILVDWFEERCKNLDLPSPKELEIENEELRTEKLKLLDTIEEIRSEKNDWHQRFLDEKYRR
jgi:hypothetical protein